MSIAVSAISYNEPQNKINTLIEAIKKDETKKDRKVKGINLKSPIAQSGFLWTCTALVDFLKRFDFISNKVSNLTHLSLFFDRLASIRFTQGILNIKKD